MKLEIGLNMPSNYLKINKCSIADGPGFRVAVYLSGCPLHCKGCHNPESWNPDAGDELTSNVIDEIIELCKTSYISGLSILGGEPLADFNTAATFALIKKFRENIPGKTIWVWSGYTLAELDARAKNDTDLDNILNSIDTAVLGRFELDKRDITINNQWRGSTNQEIIKFKK